MTSRGLMSPVVFSRPHSPSPPSSPAVFLSSPSPSLPLWSPPRLYDKSANYSTTSFTSYAASSTKTKLSKLLRPRNILAMALTAALCLVLLVLPSTGARPRNPLTFKGSPHQVPNMQWTESPDSSGRSHLVVVAGHAIWKGGPMLGEVDDEWTLEPYQRGHNESLTWVEHIEKGVEILKKASEAVLVFSGGETRPASGPRSESQSYWNLAEARGLLSPQIFPFVTTEIYARDSFENLLFSICRFKEYTGQYPESVTVVGYEFKRRRFSDVHRPALRFPADKFKYIGIDPSNTTLVENMMHFENTLSLSPFEKDPYGCFDATLVEKKKSRGWGQRGIGAYESSCPEMKELFRYCGVHHNGTVALFDGKLPWITTSS